MNRQDRRRLPGRIAKRIRRNPLTNCWEWTGAVAGKGYGQTYWEGRPRKAHRVVYELLRSAIPAPLVLDHLCRVRTCVNPRHLEIVTNRENIFRGTSPFVVRALATHCKHGHEFTPENTRRRRNHGVRECKACHRLILRRARARAKAALLPVPR